MTHSCHTYICACSDIEEATDESPWGLISIKAQLVDYEIPMTPITMLRNALGKEVRAKIRIKMYELTIISINVHQLTMKSQ